MTAADRPSVTDNARAEALQRWPWINIVERLSGRSQTHRERTLQREAFTAGAEWAAGRAETTTATDKDAVTEDAARLIDSCVPDDVPGYRYRYAVKAAEAMAARGLLATARTRPTRDDVSDAIEHSGIAIGTSDAERAADAVLALLRGGDRDE